MTDKELQYLLPDYLDGRLDDATRREIERRLETSAEMRDALDAAKLYADAVAAIDPIRAQDDFIDKVHQRIETGNGLLDRIFRPFHIKLPIELAGVAVTVMLVILLYNPFSGKLPHQAVEREERQYTKLQEPPVASQRLPAIKETEIPADAFAERKLLRRSASANELETKKLLDEAVTPPPSKTAGIAAKVSRRAPPLKTASAEQASAPPPASAVSEAAEQEDFIGRIETAEQSASPAPAVPATVPPSSALLKDVSNTPAAEYARRAESAAEPYEEPLRYSSDARSEPYNIPARKAADPEMKKRKPAAASSPDLKNQRSSDDAAVEQLTAMVQRYNGTVETVLATRSDLIRLKLLLPKKKFPAFKKALSVELKRASIIDTDTSTVSGKPGLTIILEVHAQ